MEEHDPPHEPPLPPMRAQDYSEVEDWPGYFGAVLGKGARETLIAAGEGRDTLELLNRGWRVVATDGLPEAFAFLWPRGGGRRQRQHVSSAVPVC